MIIGIGSMCVCVHYYIHSVSWLQYHGTHQQHIHSTRIVVSKQEKWAFFYGIATFEMGLNDDRIKTCSSSKEDDNGLGWGRREEEEAFLNSWMHAWMKTEIGLYSNAAAGFWPKAHFLYLLPFLEKPIPFCLFTFQHTFHFGIVWYEFRNTGFVLGVIH